MPKACTAELVNHLYPQYQRDAFLNRIRQSPEFIQFLAEMKAENAKYRHEFSWHSQPRDGLA